MLYEPRRRRSLRNVREPVELFAATRLGESREHALACDPVCRMAVDRDHAAGQLMYEGTAYFFARWHAPATSPRTRSHTR